MASKPKAVHGPRRSIGVGYLGAGSAVSDVCREASSKAVREGRFQAGSSGHEWVLRLLPANVYRCTGEPPRTLRLAS